MRSFEVVELVYPATGEIVGVRAHIATQLLEAGWKPVVKSTTAETPEEPVIPSQPDAKTSRRK